MTTKQSKRTQSGLEILGLVKVGWNTMASDRDKREQVKKLL
jgi:hypothetical protein